MKLLTWKVKILTEGSKEIGLGHIYRCLAIKEILESRKIACELIVAETNPIENFSNVKNIFYRDWKRNNVINTILGEKPFAIFIDSYLATADHFKKLSVGNHELYIIDDNNDFRYSRGTIINPSFLAKSLPYPIKNEKFKFLLGSKYTIVRPAFLKISDRNYNEDIKKILVMIGGTDVLDLSNNVVSICLEYFPDSEIHLISKKCKCDNLQKVHQHYNLDEYHISQLMLDSDFAIVGAGQTIFELIATRTPFLAIKVADNQRLNVELLEKEHLAFTLYNMANLPKILNNIEKLEQRMKVIDNQKKYELNGVNNIIDHLLLESIIIDKMELLDSEDIYKLSSDTEIRKWSKSKDKFSFETHNNWIQQQHKNRNSFFYILRRKFDHEFLGQVRFLKTDTKQFLVSISFTSELRGKKIGSELLNLALKKLKSEVSVDMIRAEILKDNIASVKVFEKSGFIQYEQDKNLLEFRKIFDGEE